MSGGVVAPERGAVSPESANTPPTDAPARPSSFGYNPALDGIRAFAVVAVLLFHGGVLTGGYLGVDAFFVLSGFLITSLIVHEVHSHGRLDLKSFWARRARRLLPALFLLLVAVSAYAVVFADRTELRRIRGDAFATLFYVANWHAIFTGHGYWDLFQAPSPLEHMWSLAIEEQFYLVWPLVMAGLAALAVRVAHRRGRNVRVAPLVFGVALVAGITSAAWCTILFDAKDSSRAYLGTDTRVAAILFGAALAAWTIWRGPVRSRAGRVLLEIAGIAAIAGIAVAWTRLNGQDLLLYRGGLLLCGLGVVVVIAAASHPTRGPIATALSWKPLVAIGLISYGLYLWHWPLYLVLNQTRTGLDGSELLALRIAASFAVAIASYWLVERPIRHHPLPRRVNLIVVPLAVSACIGAIYFSTANARALPQAGSQFTVTSDTGNQQDVRGAARQAAASGASRLLVLGDSVGVNVGKAAADLSDGTDTAVVAGAIPGCVLTTGTGGYQATLRDRTFVVPELHECTGGWFSTARQFEPETVVLVYGTGASFLDVQLDGKWVNACSSAYQSWYAQQIKDTVAELQRDGATRVDLLRLPYPTADFMPDSAHASIDCVNAVHAKVASEVPGVEVLDLATLICPDGKCRTDINGVTLRSDGLHFDEGPPADYVARWLLQHARPPGG